MKLRSKSKMKDSQRDLLTAILLSRHFSQTLTLGPILNYVCQETANSDRSLKEYQIATEVLRRSASFDPKLDPVVRVSMKSIRERLQAYFENEGEYESVCLVIPKGKYRAEFIENQSAKHPKPLPHVSASRRFWAPYLVPGQASIILHTEPLFFRDGWETYVRNLYVNDPANGTRLLMEKLPEFRAKAFEPTFHYLDSGEVHSMFLLMQFFHGFGSTLSVRNSRIASWNEMGQANLVLIGCTRTNRFMDMLQEHNEFIITDDEIRNLSPRAGEERSYRGERYYDSKLPRYKEYVLITRRPGASQSSMVTMIASNHGRAVEGAASHLTIERKVSQLISRMNLGEEGELPRRLQLLLRVEMIDLDDEIVDVDYVSHRFFKE